MLFSVSAFKVPTCPNFSKNTVSSFLLASCLSSCCHWLWNCTSENGNQHYTHDFFFRRQAASRTAQDNRAGSQSNVQYVDKYVQEAGYLGDLDALSGTCSHTLARFAQTGTRHKRESGTVGFIPSTQRLKPTEPLCSNGATAAGMGQHFGTTRAPSSDWIKRVFDITADTLIRQSTYSENEHWSGSLSSFSASDFFVLFCFVLNIPKCCYEHVSYNWTQITMAVVGPLSSSPTGLMGSVLSVCLVCLSVCPTVPAQTVYTILPCCVYSHFFHRISLRGTQFKSLSLKWSCAVVASVSHSSAIRCCCHVDGLCLDIWALIALKVISKESKHFQFQYVPKNMQESTYFPFPFLDLSFV